MGMSIPSNQRSLLRELATRVAEIAASDENAQIEARWRAVNALRTPDRAPVWCRPVGAWGELLPEAALVCGDVLMQQGKKREAAQAWELCRKVSAVNSVTGREARKRLGIK